MDLIFASHNHNKLKEIQSLLNDTAIRVQCLDDIGFHDDIEEPFHTFRENAEVKAMVIHKKMEKNVFSEDSGLVIEALDGRPGVFSARYAGPEKSDEDNIRKVLSELEGCTDRKAYYISHICLVWNNEIRHFEGRCSGYIAHDKKGEGGFGYDPVFIPDGYSQTFGELDAAVKRGLSHRSAAFNEMKAWLERNV